ncbi:MAG: antibiotic biosynthesis monooxygenase [Bacteroidetes bacterium]|nr:antibiotic biosynthesis monooxygenase [Bacteroidota bacterium]
MIIRIVKMTFRIDEVPNFIELFNNSKHLIRSFNGCKHLTLLQDKSNSQIFFTYSYWENEDCLNEYRNSDLFNRVWSETKAKFEGKPEAWSTLPLESLA